VLKKDLLQLIEDKNINDFKFLVDVLNSKKKYFDEKLNKQFFDRFVLFIIELCYLNEFSVDHKSHDNLLVNFTQYIYSSIHDSTGSYEMTLPTMEDASELNRDNHILELNTQDDINYDILEDISYVDELEGCIVNNNNDIE
jgi:hypothetical protein